MLFLAVASLLLSAAIAYLIGAVFAGPRDSFFRTKRGILVLLVLGGSFVLLPPQLIGLDAAVGPLSSAMTGGLGSSMSVTWPAAISKGAYVALWAVSSMAAFLVGIRIWQFGSPEWLGGANRAYDASPVSRVASLLPLADRVEDALDTLGRAGLTARDVPRIASDVRSTGGRFSSSLPPSDGEVFRLVASRVPAAVAASITGLLLEGAGRRAVKP